MTILLPLRAIDTFSAPSASESTPLWSPCPPFSRHKPVPLPLLPRAGSTPHRPGFPPSEASLSASSPRIVERPLLLFFALHGRRFSRRGRFFSTPSWFPWCSPSVPLFFPSRPQSGTRFFPPLARQALFFLFPRSFSHATRSSFGHGDPFAASPLSSHTTRSTARTFRFQ